MKALETLIPLPSVRETVQTVVVALLLSAIAWYLGATVWHAIMLGSAVTIVVIAVLIGTAPEIYDLDWLGSDRARSRGSRSDVSSLSFKLRAGWGRVDHSVQWKVREIARRRLAAHGLDLQNLEDRTRIVQLIGPASYDFLIRKREGTVPMRALNDCLDALDAIDPTYYSAPQSPVRGLFPFLTRQRRARDR